MKKELISFALGATMLLSACGATKPELSSYVEMDENSSMEMDIDSSPQMLIDTLREEQTEDIVESENNHNQEDKLNTSFENVLGDFDNAKDAYIALIKYMIDNSVEIECGREFFESYAQTIADNRFAILDIDGDNDDELIIDWTNPNAMAGYTSYVFKYDTNTKEWTDELESGGSLTFFDNGIIYVGAAHNQGYGEMWPYSILKYNTSTDMFEYIGFAESEDKELIIDSMGDDKYYQYEYDPTGCGTVYILEAEKLGYERGYYTKEQFDGFQNDLVGEASIIEIDYKYITKDSLDEITE